MEKELVYQTPHGFSIFACACFDFLSLFLLTALLCCACFPVYFLTPSYTSPTSFREEVMLESHLYVKSSNGVALLPSYLENQNDWTEKEKSQACSDALSYCYTVYLNEEFSLQGEQQLISYLTPLQYEGTALFGSQGERLFSSPDYEEAYFSAYSQVIQEKGVGDLAKKKGFVEARRQIYFGYILCFCLAFSLSFWILFFFVPLCFSRGRKTFGMALSKLSYVDARGLSPSFARFFLRFLFFWILIALSSLFAFGIPFCLNEAFRAYRKDRQSLTDYVAQTYLVCTPSFRLPKTPEEA